MKLITEEFALEMREYPPRSQEHNKDPMCVAKFFNPMGPQKWWVLEYDDETKTIFCYVTGMDYDELGYTDLHELEDIKLPFEMTIERDLYFTPIPLSTVKRDYGQ